MNTTLIYTVSKKMKHNVKQFISYCICDPKVPLGRWNIHKDDMEMKRKIDLANYDNCIGSVSMYKNVEIKLDVLQS